MLNLPSVAIFGDSTTYDHGLPTSEPALIGAENHGVPGATALDMYWGTDASKDWDWFTSISNPTPDWFHQMLMTDAQIIVINVGANDAGWPSWRDPPGAFEANLGAMVDLAHGFHKDVFLETPNPMTNFDMTPVADAVRSVANAHGAGVIDQFSAVQTFMPDWRDHLDSLGVHPDQSMIGLKAVMDEVTLLHAFHIGPF